VQSSVFAVPLAQYIVEQRRVGHEFRVAGQVTDNFLPHPHAPVAVAPVIGNEVEDLVGSGKKIFIIEFAKVF
jgi:hypothetical protein